MLSKSVSSQNSKLHLLTVQNHTFGFGRFKAFSDFILTSFNYDLEQVQA